jgi:hypothetical protein
MPHFVEIHSGLQLQVHCRPALSHLVKFLVGAVLGVKMVIRLIAVSEMEMVVGLFVGIDLWLVGVMYAQSVSVGLLRVVLRNYLL